MFDVNTLRQGSGNQFVEKDGKVFHYMNCWVNPFLSNANINYLKSVEKNNPTLAETEVYGLPGTTSAKLCRTIDKEL